MSRFQCISICFVASVLMCASALGVTLGTKDAQKFQVGPGSSLERFGYSIASSDDSVIIGSPGYPETGEGVVIGRGKDPLGNWTERFSLGAGTPGDNFGSAVAIDDGLAVVGALRADDGTADSGSAWLFERGNVGNAWTRVAHLSSSMPTGRGEFSAGVAVSGRTVAVGAPLEGDSGAVYIFGEDSFGNWRQQARIEPPTAETATEFGKSISLFADTLVVGAPNANRQPGTVGIGSAFIYKRSSTETWAHVATLLPGDSQTFLRDFRFGSSISLWDGTVAVSALGGGRSFTLEGSVHVYEEGAGNEWTQVARLIDDSPIVRLFGTSVSVRDGAVLVGEPGKPYPNEVLGSGAAFLFREISPGYRAKVTEFNSLEDASGLDSFGHSVALTENSVWVGAPYKQQGAAYVFAIPEPSGIWLALIGATACVSFIRRGHRTTLRKAT